MSEVKYFLKSGQHIYKLINEINKENLEIVSMSASKDYGDFWYDIVVKRRAEK